MEWMTKREKYLHLNSDETSLSALVSAQTDNKERPTKSEKECCEEFASILEEVPLAEALSTAQVAQIPPPRDEVTEEVREG
jgi:hypothetical protein